MSLLTKKTLALVATGVGAAFASPAMALVKVQSCGDTITFHEVRTDIVARTTSSTVFQLLPGASTNFSVPNLSCIKVLFTAETRCATSAAADICEIRAVINGVEMDPQAGGTRVMDSESSVRRAHAYEWIAALGESNYTLRIEVRVGNPATVFEIDDWSMDVMKYD